MKAYFKLLMLILVSTLYYGCSQDPYDWSGGKTTVAIKEISSPIVRYDMIRVQAKLDIRGAQIDNIYFVLYKNEGGNWKVEDERAPSLVDGTSDTYLLEFGGLTAMGQWFRRSNHRARTECNYSISRIHPNNRKCSSTQSVCRGFIRELPFRGN